jgi:hypothetical protein
VHEGAMALIEAGQYELAVQLLKSLIDGAQGNALDSVLKARNEIAHGRSTLNLR